MKKSSLPDRLRALREAAKLNRAQLADAASLDRSYYGRLESGEVNSPSWYAVCAVADALGVPLERLRETD